jgi:DNA repair protein RadC
VVHNHPSGNPSPSAEDILVTRKIASGGDILDIELLDHIIIGGQKSYVSMKEKGLGFEPA